MVASHPAGEAMTEHARTNDARTNARTNDARAEVLARIGAALADRPSTPDIPRDYRRAGAYPAGSAEVLDLLADRLIDYKATVHRSTAAELSGVLTGILADAGRLVVPPGLPEPLATVTADATVDSGLTGAELDAFDTVVTVCAAAAAETGTIVLDGTAGQGRRAVTLVPDRHVCVVYADRVVHIVPDLLHRLDPRRPLTFISGPSATSDIELSRVEGVHGPRTLVVVLVA
jgi:L-lactate dehydrogenase complex protein LldG